MPGVRAALSSAAVAELATALDAIPERVPTRGRVFALVTALRRFALADRHRYFLLFGEAAADETRRAAFALMLGRLSGTLAAFQPRLDASEAAETILAATHGVLLYELFEALDRERVATVLRRLVEAAVSR